MMEGLAYLREMNVASVLLRLTVAMLFGGFIGLERERKRRPAGFRTYMLVCLGAALTMLLSQYESYMVTHAWHETAAHHRQQHPQRGGQHGHIPHTVKNRQQSPHLPQISSMV